MNDGVLYDGVAGKSKSCGYSGVEQDSLDSVISSSITSHLDISDLLTTLHTDAFAQELGMHIMRHRAYN